MINAVESEITSVYILRKVESRNWWKLMTYGSEINLQAYLLEILSDCFFLAVVVVVFCLFVWSFF